MKLRYFTFTLLCLLTTLGSFAQDMSIPVEAKPTAVIEFEETEFNFGTIDSGEKVSYVFKFKNAGDAPLIITSAKGSCGCTVPFFPKVPVLPGETSEIEVEFNSKGKMGKQSKRVTINANTDPAMTFLTIKGEVLKSEADAEISIEEQEEVVQRSKEKEAIEALSPDCFAIYPNPTNETLQLKLKEHIGKSAMVEIHNELGQKVMNTPIDRISRQSTQFDVSNFTPGIYMITIRVDNLKPLTQCFVVAGK